MATTHLAKEWESLPLADLCNIIRDSYQPRVNGQLPYVGLEHIKSGEIYITSYGIESSVRSSKTKFKKDHVLYGKLRPYLDKCVLATFDGVCSTDILVLNANERTINNYLVHLLHTREFINFAIQNTSGVNHPRTSWQAINKFEVKIPDLTEQKAIVRVLTVVQSAIVENERIVEKLKQLKRSMMRHLFTRGARAENLKVSSIGEIPESWEVVQLNEIISKLNAGVSVKSKDRPAQDNEMGVLKTSCITLGVFKEDENKAVIGNEVNRLETPLRSDTILISRMNTPAFVGATAYVENGNKNLFLPDRLWEVSISDSSKYLTRWLSYQLQVLWRSGKFAEIATGTSASMKNITKGRLLSLSVAVPSVEEQRLIAQSLSSVDKNIEITHQKLVTYQTIYATLLHELMSGERKIKMPAEEKKRDPKDIFKDAFIQTYLVKNVPSPYVSHIRLEKMTYFTKRFSTSGLVSRYGTFTFGPYDPLNKYKGGLKLALNKKYIEHGDSWGYKVGSNADQIKNYAYSREVTAMDAVLGSLGQKSDNELEVLATTDFSLYKLLADKVKPTAQLVLEYINSVDVWKEKVQRLKLDETKIAKAMSELRRLISQGLPYPQP